MGADLNQEHCMNKIIRATTIVVLCSLISGRTAWADMPPRAVPASEQVSMPDAWREYATRKKLPEAVVERTAQFMQRAAGVDTFTVPSGVVPSFERLLASCHPPFVNSDSTTSVATSYYIAFCVDQARRRTDWGEEQRNLVVDQMKKFAALAAKQMIAGLTERLPANQREEWQEEIQESVAKFQAAFETRVTTLADDPLFFALKFEITDAAEARLLKEVNRDTAYPRLIEPLQLMDSASENYRRNLDRFEREMRNGLLCSLTLMELQRLMDESPAWQRFTYRGGLSYGPWPAFFELTAPPQR